jgi:ferredoxin-NADP reductase
VQILFQDVSIEFAKEKEKELIALYGRLNLGTGTLCNLTDGGDGICGWKAPIETIEKMKQAAKIRGTYMLNNPEVIAKRAESNRGKKRTPEQCERLASWQRGVSKPKEQVEKMRQSRLKPECVEKARNQPNCKKVMCIENQVVYRSAAEAARQLDVSRSAVSDCCLGRRIMTKGLTFKFA